MTNNHQTSRCIPMQLFTFNIHIPYLHNISTHSRFHSEEAPSAVERKLGTHPVGTELVCFFGESSTWGFCRHSHIITFADERCPEMMEAMVAQLRSGRGKRREEERNIMISIDQASKEFEAKKVCDLLRATLRKIGTLSC